MNISQQEINIKLIKRIKNVGLDRNPKLVQLLNFNQINPDDQEIKQLILETLEAEEIKNIVDPDPFRTTNPIALEQIYGELKIGFVEHSDIKYGIPLNDLVTNTLILGRSGGGKTSLVLLILSQILASRKCGVIIFDRKRDYRCLVPLFPHFIYIHYTNFYDNILRPPQNVSLKVWLSTLFIIMANYFDLRVASRNLLMEKSLWLFKEKNYEETGQCPTLKEVYFLLENTKYPLISNKARHAESATNRLRGILDNFGDNLCSPKRINWENVINLQITFGLDGLASDFQNFLIAVITSKIRLYIMVNQNRG